MTPRGLLAALVLALALGGCMFAADLERGDLNTCDSDDDCVQDETQCDPDVRSCEFVCDRALGACVVPAGALSETLVISITDEFGMSSEQLVEVSSESAGQPLDIAVPDPVQVTGLIMDLRGETNEVLEANVTFTRLSQYPPTLEARPITVVSSADMIPNELDLDYNFTVGLVRGRYSVEAVPIEPAGADPSVRLYYPIQQACEVDLDSFECHSAFEIPEPTLELFYPRDTRVISGRVVGPEGEPIGGARVYAANASGRISANAVTGCDADRPDECGRFTLAVPPTTDQFSLQLSGPADPQSLEDALRPTIVVGTFYFTLDANADGRLAVEDGEISPLAFPAQAAPVLFDPVIQGRGRNGITVPLAGVSLRIRSANDGTWAGGAYEFDATTDALGAIVPAISHLQGPEGTGIMLVPGNYDVEITPALGGDLANAVVSVVVAASEEGVQPQPLTIPARSLLSGHVTTPGNVPLPGVQVEATNAAGVSFSATTDELGRYSMFVDPSVYDVMFVPPEGSLLSRARRVGVQVINDAVEESALDVMISYGVYVSGAITRAATREPIVAAVVESYVVRQGDPDNPPLIPIGLSLTGTDGGFNIIIPDDEGF